MEDTVDTLVSTVDSVAGRAEVPELGNLAVACALGIVGGAVGAWFVAKRHYKTKYEELAEAEIAEAREFYRQFYKSDEYATPEGALSKSGVAAAEALTLYQGGNAAPPETVVVEQVTETIKTNLFAERLSDDKWDQVKEEEHRASLPEDAPFIISRDEFMQNEHEYQNPSLVYFAEDDVLIDEQEKPIELVDDVVGEDNLTRFGHGSNDNRMLYIRNNKLSMDFEIIKNDGNYAQDVLGFQHSGGPTVRKMRGDDG